MASARADGTTVTFRVLDPGYRLAGVRPSQDVRIPGAFGPKSVLEFAAYRPPGWLTAATVPGCAATFEVPAGSLGMGTSLGGMHKYTAWRDGFGPHLTRLLGQVCG